MHSQSTIVFLLTAGTALAASSRNVPLVNGQPFFVGAFVFNATFEPQTNWPAVNQALGLPVYLTTHDQSFLIDIRQEELGLFRLVETTVPYANLLLQNLYFRLGVENSTNSFYGNRETKYTASVDHRNTLWFDFKEIATSKAWSSKAVFASNYDSYTLTEKVGTIFGQRHYTRMKL